MNQDDRDEVYVRVLATFVAVVLLWAIAYRIYEIITNV
jgi:hypothetical protein